MPLPIELSKRHLGHEKIPLLKHIAEEVTENGIRKQEVRTLQNILSNTGSIQGLLTRAKERPDNIESRAYREWRKGFEGFAQKYSEPILKRNDEGLTEEDRTTRLNKKTGKVISELDESKKKEENAGSTSPPPK